MNDKTVEAVAREMADAFWSDDCETYEEYLNTARIMLKEKFGAIEPDISCFDCTSDGYCTMNCSPRIGKHPNEEAVHSENCECCGSFLLMEEKCDELKKHIKVLVKALEVFLSCRTESGWRLGAGISHEQHKHTLKYSLEVAQKALASLPKELRGL